MNTRMLLSALLCCVAAGTLPAALAAPGAGTGKIDTVNMRGPDGKPLTEGEIKAVKDFQMLDFNKDGKISRTELAFVPRLYGSFDDADTNHDGYLSLEEVRAFAGKYRAQRDAAKLNQATGATGGAAPARSGEKAAGTPK